MKREQPKQYTSLLMLPISTHRAEELARKATDPTPAPEEIAQPFAQIIELLLGIAAIEDAGQRQLAALCAALAIFAHTPECSESLITFVSSIYRENASTEV